MTHREQALVDQFREWRAEIDARPESPWGTAPPQPPEQSREERLAEARARRAERLGRPLGSPEPTPADRPEAATMQRVTRLDDVITKEDAEFAQWRRARIRRGHGAARGSRERRR